MAGMHFAFLAVYPFAAMLFGLGLAPRFQTMNAFKLASYGMVLVGAVGLINIVLVQHIHDVDVGLFALISNSFLMLGASFSWSRRGHVPGPERVYRGGLLELTPPRSRTTK